MNFFQRKDFNEDNHARDESGKFTSTNTTQSKAKLDAATAHYDSMSETYDGEVRKFKQIKKPTQAHKEAMSKLAGHTRDAQEAMFAAHEEHQAISDMERHQKLTSQLPKQPKMF